MFMSVCPVCMTETERIICPCCAFDKSLYYEQYPTLSVIPAEQAWSVFYLQIRYRNSKKPEPETQNPQLLYEKAVASESEAERLELMSLAAYLGCADAQSSLGSLYLEIGNPSLAAELFKKAALQGDADAAYHLSHCYRDGAGVERSERLAASWLRKAKELGKAEAKQELGDCYLFGKGVKPNAHLAEQLYLEAAANGFSAGLVYLAQCYLNGTKVPCSSERARKLLEQAEKYGNKDARFYLNILGYQA